MENDQDEHAVLSELYPIENYREDASYIFVAVTAEIDGRVPDDILFLHLNNLVGGYESNIVTYDTSNARDYWRNQAGTVSGTRGFAIAYAGFGAVNLMQGAATVMAQLTIGISPLLPRLASGTSYTDTEKLEVQKHNQRYLSQIGGRYANVAGQITTISFSTLKNTPFRIKSLRAVTL